MECFSATSRETETDLQLIVLTSEVFTYIWHLKHKLFYYKINHKVAQN